jgi:programmed cell death protein 4
MLILAYIFLKEINASEYSYEFVKRLINHAIDRSDHEREQVSKLLSQLYPDVLSSATVGKGFERLFEIIDEIELDAPMAKTMLASFLARAVVDEVLPPSFLSDSVVCNLGGEIVEQARLLLSRDHGGAKLEKIWGPGDGRPVEEMKVAVDQFLMEYILSSDLDEAIRCVKELNEPQFFHEVVKRAVVLTLDKTEKQRQLISELFEELSQIQLLTYQQAEKGFNRLFEALPDLVLDTPNAKQFLEEFMNRAREKKVVSSNYKPSPSGNGNGSNGAGSSGH